MVYSEEQVDSQQNSNPTVQVDQSDSMNKPMVKICCFRISEKTADILRIVRIRLLLTLTIGYMVGVFYCVSMEPSLFSGAIPIAFIWAETIYLCVKNEAKEWYWFSPSTFVYIVFYMACFWRGAHEKVASNEIDCSDANKTSGALLEKCFGGVNFNACQITYMLMMNFLVSTILARWWTPRSKQLNKKSHASLLAMYLSASADFFDLIEYENDQQIVAAVGVDVINVVGFLSLIQFCFNLTATKKVSIKKHNFFTRFLDFMFSTEAWSLYLVSNLQDFSSLLLRVYIIWKCGFFVNATLYFFIIKNVLTIIVQITQFRILYSEYKELKTDARNRSKNVEPYKLQLVVANKLINVAPAKTNKVYDATIETSSKEV